MPASKARGMLPIEIPQSMIFADDPKLLNTRITVKATVTRSKYLKVMVLFCLLLIFNSMLNILYYNSVTDMKKEDCPSMNVFFAHLGRSEDVCL